MLFLPLSDTNVEFAKLMKPTERSYTAAEILPTTSGVVLINEGEFAKATLDENLETFVMNISALKITEGSIYLS